MLFMCNREIETKMILLEIFKERQQKNAEAGSIPSFYKKNPVEGSISHRVQRLAKSRFLKKQSELLLNVDDLDAMWVCLRENYVIVDATGAEKINYGDALVSDFAQSDHLLLPSSASPSPSSASYTSRLLIRQIRRSLESGDVDAAIALLRRLAPAILDDHHILFRLQKQKFIELLRRGTDEDRDAAIECLRVALAPCALDAYPEAYEEFKHVLLALIFDKEDQTSPVAEEWSERRRVDLAGLLSSILRAHLNAYDPIFSMTLRYLISIHKVYCLRQGVTSPVSDLIERLLLEERDPPAPPQQILYEAPPFDEVDIQALAHAVELTRQGAVDSLKFAKGDLFRAFQNELCRMKLDVSMLDELVHEYCVYRGIIDGVITSSSGAQGSTADVVSMQGVDTEMRSASETTSNEDCSTSDTNHQRNSSRRLRRTRHHATGQGRRKRWRGRVDMLEPTTDACLNETKDIFINETNRQDLMCHDLDTSGGALDEGKGTKLNGTVENVSTVEDHEYEIVLDMKELTKNGMAAEVVEEVNAMDPDFFTQNPLLLFQLKQVEFLKLVHDGDVTMALKVASTHLGPLAASQHSLMKPLKETLLALLKPSDDAFTKAIPLSVLATSLQVALGKRLGIEEPQLMRIMRATLHTHSEWFKLQMCKDRFEEFLKIDNLKDVEAPAFNDMSSRTCTDNSHGSSQITTSSNKLPDDDNSPTQISSNEIGCDENAIIKVMEFLALPRSDAIQLLMQYDGNAEAVIQQIFS